MARWRLALVFLVLGTMVVLLSPWADAPSPSSVPAVVQPSEVKVVQEPEEAKEASKLTIEVALEEQEFRALTNLNDDFTFRHPDIEVELRRISPERAYEAYWRSSELEEAADVMLFLNEWVAEFASSGYLLPVDAKALGEQFEALSGSLRWNEYLWGVPRDMDPYVLVWNLDLLHAWLGAEADFPLSEEQWTAAAEASAAAGQREEEQEKAAYAYWLAIDGEDPLALLAWLESYAQLRSDELWEQGAGAWTGTARGEAMGLLEERRENVRFGRDFREAIAALRDGNTLAAVMPYSEAKEFVARHDSNGADGKFRAAIDHHFWNLPYVWPRGSSFVISSRTEAEAAANVWIADMTGEQSQMLRMEELDKLPVIRSLYDADRRLSDLLPGRKGQAFPNKAPLLYGPETVETLERFRDLWSRFSGGELGLEGWMEEWRRETEG
ncbi:extracellular solute-binding protein [Cohnella sp. LGH]|uniref:extracellular solute-binding protein n=1 Tax=Cohnella sp. LGH TaxID=1619153 RepID=UPI001ADCFECD|nr:extracellular solute-binding protein [Cohnella sp. LGH]QTH46115.1 extracellular solute-binding protein [Cohnella sp. LGH]